MSQAITLCPMCLRLSTDSPATRAMVQALEHRGVRLLSSDDQNGPGLRYAADHARRHPAALSATIRAR